MWRTLPSPLYRDSTEWCITMSEEQGGTRVTEGFRLLQMDRAREILVYCLLPVHRDRAPDLADDLQRLKTVVEAGCRKAESG